MELIYKNNMFLTFFDNGHIKVLLFSMYMVKFEFVNIKMKTENDARVKISTPMGSPN